MKLIRMILSPIILLIDRWTSPTAPQRSIENQNRVNHHFKNLSLYQLVACPFCVKVRRELKRLGIQPPLVNILDEPKLYEEMLKQGGRDQVPCLRINQGNQVTWLYESNEIIRYLRSELDTLKLSS